MNNVNLIGRITKDLEMQQTNNGKNYVRFTLAVNRDKDNADFISCVAWNKTAELICNYHQKGSQIGVTGAINTGSYEKDGQKVFTTDVIVRSISFVGSKDTNNNTNNNAQINESVNEEDLPF